MAGVEDRDVQQPVQPIAELTADGAERCPNPKCGRLLDEQSLLIGRCMCGCTLKGNQLARKHPKPPGPDDALVCQRLRERRAEIANGLGGVDLSPMKLGAIERFCMLELHVENWERYFLNAGVVTIHGRVRSGYSQGYLASLSQLMRLAQIIGLDSMPRPVEQSPREWLQSLPAVAPEAQTTDNTDEE